MATDQLQSLWADAQTSFEALQKAQSETARIEALAKVTKLQRALEKPKDAVLKLSYQVSLTLKHTLNAF